jgi:hypothetical protein
MDKGSKSSVKMFDGNGFSV